MNIQEIFSLNTVKDEERSSVKMEGVIPKEKINEMRTRVLEKISKTKKIDGFREGTAPPEVVEQSVGALRIWQDSAQEVIMQNFAEILAAEKCVPLGSPNMKFTSVPVGGDVAFTVEFFTMPDINLPDYTKHIKQMDTPEEPKEATDQEVQEIVNDIRRSIYKKAHPEKEPPKDEKNLPELSDKNIQEITKQHKTVESFLKNVRESVTREKKIQARSILRQKILDTIIQNTEINIPNIIIEEESKRSYEDLKAQAEHFGTTIEEYLKAQNMNEEKLWEQLKQEAKKRSKTQLIINAISAKEHIHAKKEDVEREAKRFKERGGGMSEEQTHMYIESLLTNEAVMQFLENMVPKKSAQNR